MSCVISPVSRFGSSWITSLLISATCILVLSPADSVVAAESDRLQNKCGRDAVFQVVQSFGSDLSLKQIDEAMEFKEEVSVAEVVDVLKRLGYQAEAMWMDPQTADSVDASRWNPARFSYIVALPPSKSQWWHYAFVHSISGEDLTFVQPQNGELKRVPFDGIRSGSRLGLIRIEKKQVPVLSWAVGAMGVLSSPLFLVLLCGLVGVGWLLLKRKRQAGSEASSGLDSSGWNPRWLLAGVVGLSALGFVVFHWRGSTSPSSATTVLAFSEPEYMAGSLLTATEHPVEVIVRNDANTKIEVVEVRTSCGCMRVSPAAFVLQPKEAKTLVVDVKPPGEGESTQLIQLISANESVAAETKITYHGRLPARLTPKKWHIGTIRSGDTQRTLRKTLKITDYVGEPLEGVRVRSLGENPLIDVELVGAPVFRKDGELELLLTPRDHWHRGLFTQKVLIAFEGVPEDEMALEFQVSAEMLGAET